MANTTTTVTAVADFSSLQNGFKQLNEGMNRGREGIQKFGQMFGVLSSEMGMAGKALGALGAALQGGIWGVAAAGVMLAVDALKEQKKQADDAAKAYGELIEKVQKFNEEIATSAALQAAAPGRARDLLQVDIDTAKKQQELGEKYNDVVTQLEEAKLAVRRASNEKELKTALSKRKFLEEQERNLLWSLEQLDTSAAKKKLEINTKYDKEEADKRKQLQETAESKRKTLIDRAEQYTVSAKTTAVSEEKALEESHAAKVKKINADIVEAKKNNFGDAVFALNLALDAENEAYERQKKKIQSMASMKLQDMEAKKYEQDDADAAAAWEKYNTEQAVEKQKKLKEEVLATADAAMMFGQVMGASLQGMISGQQSVLQGLTSMLAGIVQVIAQLMIQLEVAAAVAAVQAGASVAITPLIGPILAISAAAAVFSGLMAYAGKVGSAEGGWDLPGGGPFPAVLHAREMVLPAEHADTIRNLKDGAGGSTVVMNVSAMDAKSFKQFLVDKQSALLDTLTMASANRRFA